MDTKQNRREAIRRTLAQRPGGIAAARAMVEVSLATWRLLAERLAPIIGTRGVEALFSRALQLTAADFPWIASTTRQEQIAAPLAGFRARLEAQAPEAALQGSLALLVTFTDLLETLIGESLTDRLVDPVWTAEAPSPREESTP